MLTPDTRRAHDGLFAATARPTLPHGRGATGTVFGGKPSVAGFTLPRSPEHFIAASAVEGVPVREDGLRMSGRVDVVHQSRRDAESQNMIWADPLTRNNASAGLRAKPRRAARQLILALAGALSAGAVQAQVTQSEHMARLLAWLGGEWNNHEQVWQQRLVLADPKAQARPTLNGPVHWTFRPLRAPNIGARVFQVLHAPGDRPEAPDDIRLVRFKADEASGVVRAEWFALQDGARWLAGLRSGTPAAAQAASAANQTPAAASSSAAGANADPWAGLRPEQLQALPGCSMGWRYDAAQQSYRGKLPSAGCLGGGPGAPAPASVAAAAAPAQAGVELVLTDSLLSIGPAAAEAGRAGASAQPAHNRKVRYFDGWVWFKLAGPLAAADDKATGFMAKVRLHSEGGLVSVTLPDGSPSPYVLELAQLTYQNTRQPILKFALLDRASGKSLTYIWANTDATRIGMNLGWFQAGLVQKEKDPNFAQ